MPKPSRRPPALPQTRRPADPPEQLQLLTSTGEELERLLTATDAARVLTMSPENVRRLTRLRELRACAVTVSPFRPILLYRLADVEALAAKRARPHRLPTPSELTVLTEDPLESLRRDLVAEILHKPQRTAKPRRRRKQ